MADIAGTKNADMLVGTTLQDTISGGTGNDTISADDGDDTLLGGSDDDTIYGGAGNDLIFGGTGQDLLEGGSGNDVLHGGEGDDTIIAGVGNDTYQGGKGFDTINFSNVADAVQVDLSKGTSSGQSSGTDTVQGFERLVGSAHWDDLKGSNAADVIEGGDGLDLIRGMAGADTIYGGEERDTFSWRTADLLDSAGNHRGVDVIKDYAGLDTFDISALVPMGSYQDLNEVVRFENGAGGSTLQVKIADAFVDVAFLEGYTFNGDVNIMAEDKGFLLAN